MNAGSRTLRHERDSLVRLHLTRGLLAVLWAVAFRKAHQQLDATAIALLVAYPLIDAISSLIDYRATAMPADRRVTGFNGLLSTAAAIALGLAALSGVTAVLVVFGAWAAASGAAQLLLGLERRNTGLGSQWPMLIAGGLSFLVGFVYVVQATGAKPTLDMLPVYATGGGVFFIVQACLLGWRARPPQRAWPAR
ncbi:hypothetical protein [Dyella sp.]|uniref:hypothetical protein n=1 Tax=Dyella sp. TaxID=1869338 RepID=UPI003F804092